MEKMNVSNNKGELRRPLPNAYCEELLDAEDTETLSELSENELLFGFLNPNPIQISQSNVNGHPITIGASFIGDQIVDWSQTSSHKEIAGGKPGMNTSG